VQASCRGWRTAAEPALATARHLRSAGVSQANFVEREVHVVVPAMLGLTTREYASRRTTAVEDSPGGQLTQPVVQSVDALHGGRRIHER
jgi:hypothetical protein